MSQLNQPIAEMNFDVRYNEPMSKHTSYRVGGVADVFFTPKNLDELQAYFQIKQPKTVFWLGLGSNLLIRDGGIRGTVVNQSVGLKTIYQKNHMIEAEVGTSCAKLSRYIKNQSLSGLEFLSGIPGSLGGALAMNAGAFGDEIWSWVKSVTTINEKGRLQVRTSSDFEVGYRHVLAKFSGVCWFVSAKFELFKGDSKATQKQIKDLLKKRNQSQPIGQPSCGSVFKNPQDKHAAKLIEQSGLKGFGIGGAFISDKHANFIINADNASATDIEALIIHIQTTVEQKFSVRLKPEVRIVGDPA